MGADKEIKREKIIQWLQQGMSKDKADPSRLSKWLKLMECKKKLFALEDAINGLTRELQGKKPAKK